MLRVTRLFLPKKNGYTLNILTQWNQPKQVMEFSINTDEENFQRSKTFKNGKISFQHFSPLKRRDEQLIKFLEKSDEIIPSDIPKVLKTLVSLKIRSVKVLEHMSDQLQECAKVLSLLEISDILYSFAKLSYRKQNCIKGLCDVIKKSNSTITPQTVSSILHSLGILRYRDPELLNVILNSLLSFPLEIKPSVESLMSLSFLNYPCTQAETLAKFLSELSEMDFNQRTDYINFIWSCVILNQLQYISETHLPKVISNFHLTPSSTDFHPGIKLKLLNILEAAKLLLKLDQEKPKNFLKVINQTRLQERTPFFKSVIDTLGFILPLPDYVSRDVKIEAGFFLDIQYHLDSNYLPQRLSEVNSNSKKVGILLLEYRETCSDKTPTGIFAFKQRILERLGYAVVVLHHADYPLMSPLSMKTDYIRQKLSHVHYLKEDGPPERGTQRQEAK